MSNEKILIVDDDPLFSHMIELYLKRQGYEIVTALGGRDGLKAARQEKPGVIILDVMMPDLSGYEVCRLLRQEEATAETPILMLTAKSRLADKIEGFRAGTDDYLTKPAELVELLARVQALLARSSQNEQSEGRLVAFWGAKGGVGVSALAANVSVLLARHGSPAILADLQPGFGHSTLQFGLGSSLSLAGLLRENSDSLNQQAIERFLVRHRSGLRVLPGGVSPTNAPALTPETVAALLEGLRHQGDPLLLDMPAGLHAYTQAALLAANQVVLVTAGRPVSLRCARERQQWLLNKGFSDDEIAVVLVNRFASSIMTTPEDMQRDFGSSFLCIVPPATEAFYLAEQGGYPAITQPDGATIKFAMERIIAWLLGQPDPSQIIEPATAATASEIGGRRRRRGLG